MDYHEKRVRAAILEAISLNLVTEQLYLVIQFPDVVPIDNTCHVYTHSVGIASQGLLVVLHIRNYLRQL